MGLWDCAAWCIAVALIVGTRYDFYLSIEQWNTVFLYAALACLTQLAVGALLKFYRGKYRLGSPNGTSEDLFTCGLSLPSGSAHEESTAARALDSVAPFLGRASASVADR
ncbi:hypothetical protein MF406_03655 [Georgenia sp. TF02-10]|uniref:hypothetical protein n=1 Tax=Georgenia sp. TF02-10 TaxID=2917725 RepID=UPI001FA7F3B4|nr:hypothetical protein [Georgenia sp. TF02-10]UNX55376.1 hypothetical protein MF406_03655 [Georgenia sp. TF02-10]